MSLSTNITDVKRFTKLLNYRRCSVFSHRLTVGSRYKMKTVNGISLLFCDRTWNEMECCCWCQSYKIVYGLCILQSVQVFQLIAHNFNHFMGKINVMTWWRTISSILMQWKVRIMMILTIYNKIRNYRHVVVENNRNAYTFKMYNFQQIAVVYYWLKCAVT